MTTKPAYGESDKKCAHCGFEMVSERRNSHFSCVLVAHIKTVGIADGWCGCDWHVKYRKWIAENGEAEIPYIVDRIIG